MVDVSRVRQAGPLAPLAEGFAAALAGQGYTSFGAVKQLHLFANLSCWLEREGLCPGDLDEGALERFFADRGAAGHTKLLSLRAAEPLLAYLRGIGAVPAARPQQCEGPVAELLGGRRGHLQWPHRGRLKWPHLASVFVLVDVA